MSTKAKTFEECCYEIAKEDGYSWEGFVKLYGYTGKAIKWIERAAELYASEKIKRAIELARQKKKGESCAPSNFSCSWPECECTVLKYTPQQIEELLNK